MKNIKSKPIEELENEAEEDLKLRIDRTDEDSANTPSLFNKYHKEYRLVKTELINIQYSLIKLRRDKWYYYSGKSHPDEYKKRPLDIKIMKSDIKMHIDSDEDVIKMSYHIEMLEMKKNFISSKLKEINNRSFHIGNIVKTLYFKHGIN